MFYKSLYFIKHILSFYAITLNCCEMRGVSLFSQTLIVTICLLKADYLLFIQTCFLRFVKFSRPDSGVETFYKTYLKLDTGRIKIQVSTWNKKVVYQIACELSKFVNCAVHTIPRIEMIIHMIKTTNILASFIFLSIC